LFFDAVAAMLAVGTHDMIAAETGRGAPATAIVPDAAASNTTTGAARGGAAALPPLAQAGMLPTSRPAATATISQARMARCTLPCRQPTEKGCDRSQIQERTPN
jgi:hypothetical protein